MHNADIAHFFEEYADLLEIQGANPFRIRAYRNGARSVESQSASVAALARAEGKAALKQLQGIGDDLADKIVTIVETGKLPQLEQLRQEVPDGVRQMMGLPNLGPKKATALWKALNIQTLEQLKEAAERGDIAGIKGFGKKTEQIILAGLTQIQQQPLKRFLISDAKAAAEAIVEDLLKVPGVTQAAVAGSCRRRKETVGDLDIVATASDSQAAMDCLQNHELVLTALARGETKERVRLRSGLELDLRVVPDESFGAAMQYFTGSKEHNIVMRRRAQQQGLRLNEYGLYRDEELVAGRTEEDVYKALGLPWIPPELREDRGEFEAAEAGKLPKLLELSDIRGDLHMHTTATDGTATIEEMIAAAQSRGLQYIAITDHSQRVSMANGLNADRLRAHWKAIDAARKNFRGIEVLRGIECDILENARMDLPDDVLAEADWVIAVLHYGLKQPREQIMKRLLTAVRNPHVSIIGHPSGRMVGRRAPADIDYPTLFRAAADHGVMMEINANPARLDLSDVHTASAAHEYGIPIVINTDAHSTGGFDVMSYGVDQARRAGLEVKHVANTRPFGEFRKLLRNRE